MELSITEFIKLQRLRLGRSCSKARRTQKSEQDITGQMNGENQETDKEKHGKKQSQIKRENWE